MGGKGFKKSLKANLKHYRKDGLIFIEITRGPFACLQQLSEGVSHNIEEKKSQLCFRAKANTVNTCLLCNFFKKDTNWGHVEFNEESLSFYHFCLFITS